MHTVYMYVHALEHDVHLQVLITQLTVESGYELLESIEEVEHELMVTVVVTMCWVVVTMCWVVVTMCWVVVTMCWVVVTIVANGVYKLL